MASIAVSGLAIEKHFKKIYEDLDAFRKWKQQKEQEEASDHMIEVIMIKVVETLEEKALFAYKTEVEAVKHGAINAVAEARRQMDHKVEATEEKLTKRINDLEDTLRNALDDKVDKLENQIMKLNDVSSVHDDRLSQLDTDLEALNKQMKDSLADTVAKIEHIGKDIVAETRGMVRDTFHLVDDRLGRLETNLNVEMTRTTEGFHDATHHLTNLDNQVKDVISSAALKEDMILKADISDVRMKADLEDLNICSDSLKDLNRRMDFLSSKVSDDVKRGAVEQDSKLENRIQYVITLLRKERETGGGTDIGKIKCLVCDQPIPQQDDVQAVTMDKMSNTVGMKRRSASPPRERPGSPGVQVKEEDHFYHKSLASMGALPVNDALNSVIQKYAKEQQIVTERLIEANEEQKREIDEGLQRARIDGAIIEEYVVPAQVTYPPPPLNKQAKQAGKFWSNKLNLDPKYGTSTGTGASSNNVSKEYFKSLEMKFGSSGSTGRRHFESAVNVTRRPGTASGGRSDNPLLARTGAMSRPGSARK